MKLEDSEPCTSSRRPRNRTTSSTSPDEAQGDSPIIPGPASPTGDTPGGESRAVFSQYKVEVEFPVALFYQETDDELVEDARLEIMGETPEDEYSGEEPEGGLPIRLLSDFTIYERNTNELIHVAELTLCDYNDHGASGLVSPWTEHDDEDEEEEDDPESGDDSSETDQRVKLSKILQFDIHSVSHHSIDR